VAQARRVAVAVVLAVVVAAVAVVAVVVVEALRKVLGQGLVLALAPDRERPRECAPSIPPSSVTCR
jgi:hypothetical protein